MNSVYFCTVDLSDKCGTIQRVDCLAFRGDSDHLKYQSSDICHPPQFMCYLITENMPKTEFISS